MFRIRGPKHFRICHLGDHCHGRAFDYHHYFKRGLQGRWKGAMEELGDQYDPRTTNSSVEQRSSRTLSRTSQPLTTLTVFGRFAPTLEFYRNEEWSITVGGY